MVVYLLVLIIYCIFIPFFHYTEKNFGYKSNKELLSTVFNANFISNFNTKIPVEAEKLFYIKKEFIY